MAAARPLLSCECVECESHRGARDALLARVAVLEQDLAASHHLNASFFEALKPTLTAVNVSNPGAHVRDLIHERDALRARVADLLKECRECAGHGLARPATPRRDGAGLVTE
jgi:hypothetical protein